MTFVEVSAGGAPAISTDPHGSLRSLSTLTAQATLAELPMWDVRMPVTALGKQVDDVLRNQPDLPGVVVFDSAGLRGAISRSQFQHTISQPFGREVIGPREIGVLIDELAAGEPILFEVDTPVQEAVRRSLSRNRSMIYEPILTVLDDARADVRLIGFTDLLRADSRISYLRNQQMHEIMVTVQEGLLLVDRDHRIASEYSRSVETILRRSEIGGISLPELLGDLLGEEFEDLVRGYLETLFNPNVIEKLVGDINPLRTVKVSGRDGRPDQHLTFGFRRSMEASEIRRILVRVEDRTRETELAGELEEQERKAGQRFDLAMEMLQIDPQTLTDYLTRFLVEMARVERLCSGTTVDGQTVNTIFRTLHSLKGEAGVIGLRSFADKLHRSEDAAQSIRDWEAPDHEALEPFFPWLETLLGLGAEAKDLVERLSALASGRVGGRVQRSERPDIETSLLRLIDDLGSRLGKQATLVTHWKREDLPSRYDELMRDVLIQLVRNSMAHGIEIDAERRRAGKPIPAVLQFAVRKHEEAGQLEVVFQDDGRGLDLERIRSLAGSRMGIAGLDDEEARQIIFEPGFTTSEETTADAGRGVGLDLVKEIVERHGGMILAHSEPGIFCAFQIVLPLVDGATLS